MYSNIKEKFKLLFKHETKIEHYEKFLVKVQIKQKQLIKKNDKDAKERLKIINNLIEKLEKKIRSLE